MWVYYTSLFENIYQNYLMYYASLIKWTRSSELSINMQMLDKVPSCIENPDTLENT